jgi:phosphatidylserine decarboxylase
MNLTDLRDIVLDFPPRSTVAHEGWLRTGGFLAAGGALTALGRWMQRRPKSRRYLNIGRLVRLSGQGILGLGAFSVLFYRDPERFPLGSDPDFVYAPADGKITEITYDVDEPKFVGGPAIRIIIASGLLDSHIQRTPVHGQVRYVFKEDDQANYLGIASQGIEAERRVLVVQQHKPALLRFPQWLSDNTPGLLRVQAGAKLELCQKIGLAGFGQPTEVALYLPQKPSLEILCTVGQHVQAGMTVLGRFKVI